MTGTVTLTDAEYQRLQETQAFNQYLRREALEEGRLWCKERHGTETLAEGLRACTVDELEELYSATVGSHGSLEAGNWVYELCRRLKAREAAQAAEQAALTAMATVMPEEEV